MFVNLAVLLDALAMSTCHPRRRKAIVREREAKR